MEELYFSVERWTCFMSNQITPHQSSGVPQVVFEQRQNVGWWFVTQSTSALINTSVVIGILKYVKDIPFDWKLIIVLFVVSLAMMLIAAWFSRRRFTVSAAPVTDEPPPADLHEDCERTINNLRGQIYRLE